MQIFEFEFSIRDNGKTKKCKKYYFFLYRFLSYMSPNILILVVNISWFLYFINLLKGHGKSFVQFVKKKFAR